VIEISESSLTKDLGAKSRIYAAAAVPTYRVIELDADTVHVHSQPQPCGYAPVERRGFAEPLEAAGVRGVLADLLAC
jgi:Uma2 family endonuclease